MRMSQDWQAATVRRTTLRSPCVRELEPLPGAACTRPEPGRHLPMRLTAVDGQVLTRQDVALGRTDVGLAWRIAVRRCRPSRGGSAALQQALHAHGIATLRGCQRGDCGLRPARLRVARARRWLGARHRRSARPGLTLTTPQWRPR